MGGRRRHQPPKPREDAGRLFALLGTKTSDKRHIVVDGGHYPPQELLVKETVEWLDRYLGPVQ